VTATAVAAPIIIIAGALARRAGLIEPRQGPVLVRLVINVFMPPLVLVILLRADLEPDLALVPVAGWLVHLSLVALVLGTTRGMRLQRPRTGALVVAAAVGNTGFFGLPLIAASGPGFSQAAAVMYDTLCTSLVTWTSTVAIASAYGDAHPTTRIEPRLVARSLLLPPNLAAALGLFLNLVGVRAEDLPRYILRPLELLGGAVLPVVMIYAGVLLEVGVLRRVWRQVSFVTVVRLGVAALLGLGIGLALGFGGATLHTVVLMAAMPTAMMSLVLGSKFRLRTDVIAGAVVVTTLLATLTLPAIRSALL
jgi:predicted permease